MDSMQAGKTSAGSADDPAIDQLPNDNVDKKANKKSKSSAEKAAEESILCEEMLTNAMLKERIQELEEQKIRLLLSVNDYKDQTEQLKADQLDAHYFLNKKLDDNHEIISSLEEQLLNEQADRELSEKMYEKKIDDFKAKVQSDEQKFNSKYNEIDLKLQSLREYAENKALYEKNLATLMATLEKERAQFRIEVS